MCSDWLSSESSNGKGIIREIQKNSDRNSYDNVTNIKGYDWLNEE